MIFYLVLFSSLFISSLLPEFFLHRKNKKLSRFLSVFFPILLLFLVCVLKSNSVGYDTVAYATAYEKGSSNFEPLFSFLMVLFHKMGFTFRIFQIFVYLVIFIPLGFVIYKTSQYPGLTIFLYCSWWFLVFSFSGIRQSMAISLCLLAIYLASKRNFWSIIFSLAIVILSGFLHKSAFIVCIIYPLLFAKDYRSFAPYLLLIQSLFFIFVPYIYEFIFYGMLKSSYLPDENSGVGELTVIYMLLYLFLVVMSFSNPVFNKVNDIFSHFDRLKRQEQSRLIEEPEVQKEPDSFTELSIVLFGFSVIFETFSRTSLTFTRISYSFLILGIFAIPNVISLQKSRVLKLTLYLLFVLGFLGFFFVECFSPNYLHCNPYSF